MTNVVLPPADQQQRLAALDPHRCVCVTAPAGAGKTQLLSQRVLTLLARADQPEEILAITFTRKAAAEMHHRIMQALHLALEEEPNEEHKRLSWQLAKKVLARDKQCCWQLLANPNRLKIQTIDSLCANLTKQMPILANFGAQPQIAENAQPYYRTAVHNLLRQLETDSNIAMDLMNLLAHVDNDMAKVERLLMSLLQRRDQWLLHIGIGADTKTARNVLEQTLKHVTTDVLRSLHQALQPVSAHLLPLLDYAGDNLQQEHSPSAITALAGIKQLPETHCSAIAQWNAIADVLLTKTGSWRKSIDKRTGFPAQTQDGNKPRAKQLKSQLLQLLDELSANDNVLSSLHELRYLPGSTYTSKQWVLLESLTRLLPSLVAQLTLVFQQSGEVDYSQMAIAALRALGDGLNPSELALKLDYQLRHILVDEFQDTASTHYILLERLVEGWQEYNANNPERPNTVFIVGDGMQSIYGFREANVGLFLAAKKHGINGLFLQNLPLTVNFRSTPTVVNWVNNTFSQAFPATENLSRGAVPYEQAYAFKTDENNSCVQVLGFTGDQSRIQQAQKTLELVQLAIKNNPTGSIAVLVRSRSHLRDIIPVFSRAGILWNATDIDPLSNVNAIIDLLSLTKALLNRADRISWSALLRTPWIGLTNLDLHTLLSSAAEQPPLTEEGQISTHQQSQSVWSLLWDNKRVEKLSRHGQERLLVVREILRNALAHRQRLPIRSWIEGIWLQLGGAGSLSEREQLTAVDDYFDLLEQFQQGDITALDEFEQAVHALYASPTTNNSPLQVMTIHKAKGLEFDTVILPDVARAARSDDKSLLMWREYLPGENTDPTNNTIRDSGLIISPLGEAGSEEDSIYQHLRYEKMQSATLENTRLLYVAATRAVKQLYILFEAQHDKKTDEIKPPAKNSLLNSAWPVLKDKVVWQSKPTLTSEQIVLDFDTSTTNVSLSRLAADWSAPKWNFNNPLEDYYLDTDSQEFNNGADDKNRPTVSQNQIARCVGTVTHQILEQLVYSTDQLWLTMSSAKRQRWLENILHHVGLSREQWPHAINDISHAVDNTLNDEKGRWILSSSHQHSMCEWELLVCFPNAVKQRIIDRSFIDSDGVHWIIDYKTSQPHNNESQEAFVQRETRMYHNQLAEYATYLSMMGHQQGQSKTIKTALYFTYYPYWQELAL